MTEQSRRIRRPGAAGAAAAAALLLCGCSASNHSLNAAILQSHPEDRDSKKDMDAQIRLLGEAMRASRTDYRLGPGDVLEISIFGFQHPGEQTNLKLRVSRTGHVRMPLLGVVKVGGFSVEEMQASLEELIKKDLMRNPIVSAFIAEYASRKVAVMGALASPGIFSLKKEGVTLVEALAMAGGVTEKAGYEAYVVMNSAAQIPSPAAPPVVKTTNGKGSLVLEHQLKPPEIKKINLSELLKEGRLDLNFNLGNGDVVFVPEAEKVYVVGFVKKPGEVLLKNPLRVLDAVASVGGVQEKLASPSMTVVRRKTPKGDAFIPIDLEAVAEGKAKDFYLQPGDVVEVRQSVFRFLTWEILDIAKSFIRFTAVNLDD